MSARQIEERMAQSTDWKLQRDCAGPEGPVGAAERRYLAALEIGCTVADELPESRIALSRLYRIAAKAVKEKHGLTSDDMVHVEDSLLRNWEYGEQLALSLAREFTAPAAAPRPMRSAAPAAATDDKNPVFPEPDLPQGLYSVTREYGVR